MGLFAAITGLFRRSSGSTKEAGSTFSVGTSTTLTDRVNEVQNVSISGGTSLVSTSTTSTNTPTPVFTFSTPNVMDTHTTVSTSVGDVIIDEEGCACGGSCTCQEEPEEEGCACGGSCTCKEEPEEEVVNKSSPIQATFPGMDDLPIDTKPEIEPPIKVYKIEDASTLPPISSKKLKQPKLPGFEDVPTIPPKAKKKSNIQKSGAKLVRKSTAKRKK